MPNAVLHVILTIICIDIFRDYILPKQHHKRFPRWMVLAGGIAGLMPDIDFPISWISQKIFGQAIIAHGGITHTLLAPIILLIIGVVLHYMHDKRESKMAVLFWILAFGWMFHLALDCYFLGAYNPLWPLQTVTFCPHTFSNDIMPGFDAALLILWLLHEEMKHKIKDYI